MKTTKTRYEHYWYEYVSVPKTFFDARQYCADEHNGRLAKIVSAQMFTEVFATSEKHSWLIKNTFTLFCHVKGPKVPLWIDLQKTISMRCVDDVCDYPWFKYGDGTKFTFLPGVFKASLGRVEYAYCLSLDIAATLSSSVLRTRNCTTSQFTFFCQMDCRVKGKYDV